MPPREPLESVLADTPIDELHVETLIGGLRVGLRRALAGLSKHGVYVVDNDGVLRCISPSAARILGYRPDELIGRYTHPIIHHHRIDGSEYPNEECVLRDVTEPVLYDTECLWTKDGRMIRAIFRAQPVLGDDGSRQGTMVFFEKVKPSR